MPWVVDPTTGYQVWEELPPGYVPVESVQPSTGKPAPPLSRNDAVSGIGQSAGGQAVAPQAADPRSKLGQPVPNRPGYTYEYNAQGQVVPVATNQQQATAAGYRDAIQQGPTPTAPSRITVDPATGLALNAPKTNTAANDPRGGNVAFGGAPSPHGRPGPAAGTAAPAAAPAATGAGTANFVTTDYSPQQQAIARLQETEADFYRQLDRLSGVDPFGNQAAIRQGTDRAVAQAAGTAAGARGGAAALAGAQRQAVGVQAQTAARATSEIAAQRRQDQVQAAQLGIQTVGGIADIRGQIVGAEKQMADQALATAEVNLRSYLGGRDLDQRERESLRNLATQIAQIDQQRYQTDTAYRQSVDDNVTRLMMADKTLEGVMAQIEAGGEMTGKDWMMGLFGLAAGGVQGVAMKSDRRSKFDIHDPDLRDLQDYLGRTKGKLYRYKDPSAPGQRAGLNFGPMAQDLAKSKIGRTVVVEGKDGLYVDTGRLALADHAALAALAAEVAKLKGGSKK